MAAPRLGAVVLIAATAGLLCSCEQRITAPSLVLRLASPDKATDATGVQIQHFAQEVHQRSGGTLRIDPVWDVTPAGTHGWDQIVARGVARGTWDMGLVPGRAWDELGVTRLRALNAPFLINGPAALEAVLDSNLRDDLLSDLPAAGVVGLDLYPDAMRHPFGDDEPLLGPEDYQGQVIRTTTSDTVRRMFVALGATPTDADPAATQRGAESQYSLTQTRIATGNVTFFPKTDALVMQTSVRERLRDDQWSVLRDAAAETRTWLFAQEPSDLESAATFCSHGGSIVAATPNQVAGLEDATAVVTDWLRRDPDTRHLIDEIRSLVAGVPAPTPVTRCPGPATATGDDAELHSLDGRYTSRVTDGDLRAAGVRDAVKRRENSGRITWILSGGSWTQHQVANHFVANPDNSGTYTYRNGLFTLHWESGPAEWTTARLRVARDGTIRFHDIRDGHAYNQALSEGTFRQPWFRIGN
jgi:TRAP-type C4-dicarboxylate transport system substrate-binding protein